MVAEDEPEVRDYLEISLRSLGYPVDFAEDGEEALSYSKGKRFRLLPPAAGYHHAAQGRAGDASRDTSVRYGSTDHHALRVRLRP